MLNHRLPARATRETKRGAQIKVAGTALAEAGASLSSWSGVVEADMAGLWGLLGDEDYGEGFQDLLSSD